MMKVSLLITVITVAMLTGCMNLDFDASRAGNFAWAEKSESWKVAIDYYNIRTKSDTRLYTMKCPLAWSYGRVDPRILEYYEQALVIKGLSPEHVQFIRRGELAVGMPEFAIYAAWGLPHDTNTDNYKSGTHRQFVYGLLGAKGSMARKYAYTQNGVITSFSLR